MGGAKGESVRAARLVLFVAKVHLSARCGNSRLLGQLHLLDMKDLQTHLGYVA